MKISDLKVIVLNDKGNWTNCSVSLCPNYLALLDNDWSIHDNYEALQHKWHPELKDITSTEEYIKTYESIKLNGFNFEMEPKIKIVGSIVTDGHHRICILFHLFGDIELVIKNDYLSDIIKN